MLRVTTKTALAQNGTEEGFPGVSRKKTLSFGVSRNKFPSHILGKHFKLAFLIMSSSIQSKEMHPSMMYLVGKREWDDLKNLLQMGVYDSTVNDRDEMASIIAFSVNFHAPIDFLHFLCNLNPSALLDQDLPFRLARRIGSNTQTIIVLEAARQKALVHAFNNSSSSLLSLSGIANRSTRSNVRNVGCKDFGFHHSSQRVTSKEYRRNL